MTQYIFFTDEGYTYQPGSVEVEPDVENLQILGFARGRNARDAFHTLLRDNPWLHETTFCHVVSMPLAGGWETSEQFLIPDNKSSEPA